MKRILVTGSGGLIGSAVVSRFASSGWRVLGIDNNYRSVFFGEPGSVAGRIEWLKQNISTYTHASVDIRDVGIGFDTSSFGVPDLIVHCAAQPSHDWAVNDPILDFDINAVGTLRLLEYVRKRNKDCVFVYMSTNKVYGDRPNSIPMVEGEKRWCISDSRYVNGIAEDFPIDQSLHSVFGVSKTSADLMVQEYGRNFGIPTAVLRGGCLTGSQQAGVELHGFLNYLIKKNLEGSLYRVFGYKGKQVRDNIHAEDVADLIFEIYTNPGYGEVFNVGGGIENSCSILEAFSLASEFSGREMCYEYYDENRKGDHLCYYTDLTRVRERFPMWKVKYSLKDIFKEIYNGFLYPSS